MARTDRIDLAHVDAFGLGRLRVEPARHQLLRDDGESEILQHRVMQVLVALAQADGAIVTRDELTMSCWDGRVVGEDAINRILSRLRAVAAGIGAGSFRIETVTRVGYRLVAGGTQDAEAETPQAIETRPRPSRRMLIAGSCAAAVAALGTAGWWTWFRGHAETLPPADVAPLIEQAQVAIGQETREGANQAIGLLQRVVALEPDYADGWGMLGCTYAGAAGFRQSDECAIFRQRARAAATRALTLDPDNVYGQVAIATAQPSIGNWLAIERALRPALAQHERNPRLLYELAVTLAQVDRLAEALPLMDRLDALRPPTPNVYFVHIRMLWSANRLEETDRMMAQAASVYPTHFAIWFIRFYILLFSGRVSAAIALAEDSHQRPSGIPRAEFESVLRFARAMESRDPVQTDAVMAEHMARAHQGAGYAEVTMQFAGAMSRLDDVFAVANAYYFGRGFSIPELRFTSEQSTYSPLRDRLTSLLFQPVFQPMRADPRFDLLVTELGLKRYWAEAGVRPDYQRS